MAKITKIGNVVTVKNSAGSRLLNSVGAVFIGIGVIILCLIVITCNEAASVKDIRANDEYGRNLIEIGSAQVHSANDGKLVAIRGTLTFSPVSDPAYRIATNSFVINRFVEMYQWDERRHGSSTDAEKTYEYSGRWSGSPISSSAFFDKTYVNKPWPTDAALQSRAFYADDAQLGDFRITPEQLEDLSTDSVLAIPESAPIPGGFNRSSDGRYIHSGSIADPQIGDMRVSFKASEVTRASALGRQQGNAIVSYTAKNGKRIDRVFPGEMSGADMVGQLQAENSAATWAGRIVLTILMCIGFSLLFSPIKTLTSMIPFLGKFLGKATQKVAQVIGAIAGIALSLLVIALSWIAVRPLVAIPLLLITAGLIVFIVRYRKAKALVADATPTATETAPSAGWTCECGHAGNSGKFCANCGKPQPAPQPTTWNCECGHTGITGKFCPECGKPRP
jgi:hypothetical protein